MSLVILASLGLIASLTLGHETLQVLKNPDYSPACDVNPIISCGTVMASAQAEIFGIPNPVFGIIGFTALLTFSVMFLMGVNIPKKLWLMVGAVGLGGVAFAHYLFIVSMFVIGSICPWCSMLWVTSIAIFWLILTHTAASGVFDWNKTSTAMAKWWVRYATPCLIVWYLILIVIIFIRFNDYWLSLI